MSDICSSSSSWRKPRLFFTLCCVFSSVILLVSLAFVYFPEAIGLPTATRYERQDTPTRKGSSGKMSLVRRKGSGSSSSSSKGEDETMMDTGESDSGGDVLMMEYSGSQESAYTFVRSSDNEDEGDDEGDEDNDGEEAEGGSSPKKKKKSLGDKTSRIRHPHRWKHQQFNLEDSEEQSFMSNLIETRMIHLDLKGANPKVSYLKDVLRIAKQAGITGVLIEWEDTFPWAGTLKNLSMTEGGYSMEEVEDLLSFAEKSMGLEVIPLVQTFGHVEFILKGPEFLHLREVDNDPQSFCPSKPGTMDLIKEMIDQTLRVHKNSRFIHIGCDEVANLRVCPVCTSSSEYKDELFLRHVTKVGGYVRSQGRVPIVWDDMLRSVTLRNLNESGIGAIVEPMVWVYAEDVDRFVGWEAWEKYAAVFPTVWGAAAFKGAFGETLTIPPLSRHADNVQRWIEVIGRESPKWKLGTGGIVLTGWQRYDHFAVLCEVLPAAIPSLVYSSLITSIPESSEDSIKNRIFVPKSTQQEHIESPPPTAAEVPISVPVAVTTLQDNVASSSSSIRMSDLASTSTTASTVPVSQEASSTERRKRSAPSARRKTLLHPPRILMAKDKLSKFSSQVGYGQRTVEVYDKGDRLSKRFSEILHCPNYHTRIDALVKSSDGELNFASRCNFPGVAFFRVLFRLRGVVHESWEAVAKVERKRGWVTPYNVRHNFSLPSRVNEVVFSSIPRLRRQLELNAAAVETSLQPVFRQQVIMEWIEQNVWEAWKALDRIEKDGDTLRKITVWGRRPLQSPWEMIHKLKLSRVTQNDQEQQGDEEDDDSNA